MDMQREQLMYMLVLRQIEEQSRLARAALARLEASVAGAKEADPNTVILDWLAAELMALHRSESDPEHAGTRLLKHAIALCSVLKR